MGFRHWQRRCAPWAALLLYGSAWAGTLSSPIQITTTGGREPTVSPDGGWVAYAAASGGIKKIPSSGGAPSDVANTGSHPDWCWATANDLVLFVNGDTLAGPIGLYTVSPSGGTPALFSEGYYEPPDWSPNGDEIAVQGDAGSVRLLAWPGGTQSLVACSDPDLSSCDGETPTWSPGGSDIAFEDGSEILRVPRTGGTATTVVSGLRDVAYPAWSPDGRWIAFTMQDGNFNAHIWIADSRGIAFGLQQVTEGEAEDYRATWSPDSNWIYFDSNRTGQSEIWKVELPPVTVRAVNWSSVKALYR